MSYTVELDPYVILSENANPYSSAYMEAKLEQSPEQVQQQIEVFTKSIVRVYSTPDKAIAGSKGSIKAFKAYDSIVTNIRYLNKIMTANPTVRELNTIKNYLERYIPEYSEGYNCGCKLITIEYETAMDILITGILYMLTVHVEMRMDGVRVEGRKRPGTRDDAGIVQNLVKNMSLEIASVDHSAYLKDLATVHRNNLYTNNKVKNESAIFSEGAAWDLVKDAGALVSNIFVLAAEGWKLASNGWKTLKASMFGILPIIRSIIYLRYKRKANIIQSLEEQAKFIELNIEQVKTDNTKTEQEKAAIIKKQEAYIAAYNKKAEKLRAQLTDSERSASIDLKKEDSKKPPSTTKPSPAAKSSSTSKTSDDKKDNNSNDDDDDFILEQVGV